MLKKYLYGSLKATFDPNAVKGMEWQYFTGDCSSAAAQQQAKENFIQGVKEVIGNGDPKFCETTKVCDLESIRVTCGKTTSRKRSLGYSVSNYMICF